MSWDLALRAVIAPDLNVAIKAARTDEHPAEMTLELPDVVNALVSGHDLEDDQQPGSVEAAAVFGGDAVVEERIMVMEPATVKAVSAWMAGHDAADLATTNAGVVADRLGGPVSPEIAEHLAALYDELRDFYAQATWVGAFVLKWPE